MLFTTIRSLICPFDIIEQYVPKQGKILDLGCGHGIFSFILAQRSSRRDVLGIDPADNKIRLARKNNTQLPNLKFQKLSLENLESQTFDCVTILDVFYLIPPNEKIQMLKKIKKILKKGGLLIIKEINTNPKWLFFFIKLEEYLMVNILRYTFSSQHKFYFLSQEEYKKLIEDVGFKVKKIKVAQRFIYRHIIFKFRVK